VVLKQITKESFETKTYDCIISINVHENVEFLLKQLKNIQENVACSYLVILNCNNYMHHYLSNMQLPPSVVLHNLVLNKSRDHGSLEHGIYNNMVFARETYQFKYFICCSSRNFFANNLQLSDLESLIDYASLPDDPTLMVGGSKVVYTSQPDFYMKYQFWHWITIFTSKLGKYCIKHQYPFYTSPHEGLVFNYECCSKMIDFLDSQRDLQIDLFHLPIPAEEFGLQTIAKFLGFSFYYIGNGCCNESMIPPNNMSVNLNKKFMYKVKRI
jgi:hypothetical protein